MRVKRHYFQEKSPFWEQNLSPAIWADTAASHARRVLGAALLTSFESSLPIELVLPPLAGDLTASDVVLGVVLGYYLPYQFYLPGGIV